MGLTLTPVRRRMLLMLAEAGLRPVTYTELHDALGYRSKATTMQHLVVLRGARLVERVGSVKQHIGYRLCPGVVVSRGGHVYRLLRRNF